MAEFDVAKSDVAKFVAKFRWPIPCHSSDVVK